MIWIVLALVLSAIGFPPPESRAVPILLLLLLNLVWRWCYPCDA